jgi:hypothetical protein
MRRTVFLGWLAVAVLAAGPALAGAAEQWLHVAVDEHGPEGSTVRVNVPLNLVTKILPLIRHDNLTGGKVKLEMGDENMSVADLRAILEAVRSSRDGDFVTVDGPHEKVRVAKRGDLLFVQANEDKGKRQAVEVKLPLTVLDALVSATDKDELNLTAAIEALARLGTGDLVTVDDEDSHVRIWIDSNDSPR